MRKTVFALAALLAAGCQPGFDVTVTSRSTVQNGGLVGQLVGVTFGDFASMDIASSSEFKNAGVDKDDVESVRMKSLELAVVSPAAGTFSFMDAVAFSVATDGQPTRRVAHREGIPDEATRVQLAVDDVELKPYVVAPAMSLTTEATARAPQQDTTIEATVVFEVVPQIF